jgi:hypothetical protein
MSNGDRVARSPLLMIMERGVGANRGEWPRNGVTLATCGGPRLVT